MNRRRLILLGVVLGAVAIFVGALAWWESRFPLKYLDARRCSAAQAQSRSGRFRRDLSPGEIAGLCSFLRAAREVGEVDGASSVTVELMTQDYDRVVIEDLSGPGARITLFAGKPAEKCATVKSDTLGTFLESLRLEAAQADQALRGKGPR